MAGALAQSASGAEAQYAYGKQLKHEGGIEAQAWAGAPGGKGAGGGDGGGGRGGGGDGAGDGGATTFTVTLVATGNCASIAVCTAATAAVVSALAKVI